jgi:signal transduction histidine kinase
VVQEAVSNAVRHAPGAVVEVAVRRVGGELLVTVLNGPAHAGERPVVAAPGSGHGLIGMRERVGLLDGTLHTEPRPDGGYVVEAAIPLTEEEAG